MRIRAIWPAEFLGALGLFVACSSSAVNDKAASSPPPPPSTTSTALTPSVTTTANKRMGIGPCDHDTPITFYIDLVADDDGLAWIDPDMIRPCPGDTLVWNAKNECQTCSGTSGNNPKKKKMKIGKRKVKYPKLHPSAQPDFLATGCTLEVEVDQNGNVPITCDVDANATPALYKYAVKIHNTTYDPEVEVQEPPPFPRPLPKPSPSK